MRPDVVPQEYCDELLHLVDDVPRFSWSAARRIIEEDIGPVDTHFRWINKRSIAAGSLAQVHFATTLEGEPVAVKVLRPGIGERVRRDLGRADLLARVLRLTPINTLISPTDVLAEIREWMHRELDLQQEQRNLRRMGQLSRRDPHVRIPAVYAEHSGRRVLTMELMRGTPFAELLRHVREGHPDRLKAMGLDADSLARNLVRGVLTQIFRNRLFHADTHPGNVLGLADSVVGFVDFGLVDALDATFQKGMTRYIAAVYADDDEGTYSGLVEVLADGPGSDHEGFRQDFFSATRKWRQERDGPERFGRGRSPLARYLVDILRAARANRMRVPVGILAMYRSLLTAETVARQISPTVDLRSMARDFFVRVQIDEAIRQLEPGRVGAFGLELASVVERTPGQLQRLLADVGDDRFQLQVQTAEGSATEASRDDRTRLLGASVLAVCVSILTSGLWAAGGHPIARSCLEAALVACFIAVALAWRRLRAR